MSVLIKGMEMPENCGCCDFSLWDSCSGDSRCLFSGKYTSAATSDGKRNTDCPLVEVPSHGDLIDRSELLKKETAFGDCEYTDYGVTTEDTEEAPIVIPADHGAVQNGSERK